MNARPKLFHLGYSGFRVVGDVRADLDADKAIAAIRLFVQGSEQITRGADIFNRQLPEDLFRVPACPRQRRERGIVVLALRNGVVEDAGVLRHAADVAALDHGSELAVLQLLALDVIQPE